MRHMRSRRILAILLALSMIFGLLTTTAFAGEVDQNTSNVGESAANGTSEGGSGEGQSSGASEDESSKVTNKEDVTTGEETIPEEKKTTSDEEVDTQEGEGMEVPTATTIATDEALINAINNAVDGDTITLAEGQYQISDLIGLSNANKAVTISAETNATVILNAADGIALHGAKITFNGITFQWGTANYKGIQHASELEYNDCIINGKVFLYAGKETFNHCTFNQDSADYCVWTYGAAETTFNDCTFNCKGKAVLVYNEGYIKTVKIEVNNTTFAASETVDKKAAIELDTHLMKGASITVDNASTATGFSTNTTDGAGLWNAKRIDSENNETVEVVVGGEVKYTLTTAPVAMVNGVSYDKLEDAFAALSDKAYTLTLNDESAWDTATPVYWAAGTQSGYEATLAEALTAAYKAKADYITIICRPGADVGTMTHGHVADDITIYGNNAYVSGGECDLEVDTFKFDRSTGRQATDGVTLDKDITITAYELDNLGVWGQRNTNNTVNVNLTDCDTVNAITVQRVYISGTTGVNNITLSGCDFGTKATSVYSNADGKIEITDCSFTGAQVPVNFNHKADGGQTLSVSNCKFNACGDAGEWATFAAPVRFVNSGSGKQSATVDTCTFADTVGNNGDILIGDGRTGEKSNDVSLTVTNTTATVMAQKPGYYANDGTTDNALKGEKALTAGETLTNASINSLISGTTATKGTEANPYTLDDLGAMTRDAYIAAQKELGGTMYVTVGDYIYDKNGVLGNGKRDDTTGQTEDRSVLNGYNSNGYLGENNDGANGLNIVFVNGSITSGVTGYTSIDNIGTSLLLAVPAYTNVTFKGITFNNVMCFNYQLYTSPWSQLGELKFDGCTFNGIIVGATAAQTLTFNGCEFTNYTNSDSANNSNPTWIRPAYGNWKESDNEGQDENFKSLTTINFTNNNVTSTRPVKFEFISQWNKTTTLTATGNTFDISAQDSDTETKNVGLYIGPHTDKNAVDLVLDKNTKSERTAALYVIPKDMSKLPVGSTVKDSSGTEIEITDALEWKTDTKVTLKTEPVPAVKNVAKVGETEYATLEAAVAAVTDTNNTITLLTDVIQNTQLALNRSLTLNLDGHTIKNENDIWGEKTYCLLRVEDNAVVTITGNGTVAAKKDDCYAISITSGSLTIENGTFIGNISAVQVETGSLTIKDGTFKQIQESKYGNTYVINCIDGEFASGAATVAIYGGTFVGFDPNVSPEKKDENGNVPSFAAPGVGITKNADGTFTAKAGMVAQILDASGNSVKAYKTLAEAFTEASEGQTVRLLANATEDVTIGKNITLDLGGKMLTNTGAGKATITIANGATATVKNGSVVGGTSYYNIQNNGTATFEGLTATAGNNGSSMIDNLGTLTITSGEYTGGLDTIKNEPNAKLTINGGEFTLTTSTSSGFNAVVFNYGDLAITAGTFTQSVTTGQYVYAQVVHTDKDGSSVPSTVITGGTFKNLSTKSTAWVVRASNAADGATKVSGGTFNKSVSESYWADGFEVKRSGSSYVAQPRKDAQIGTATYSTLADALEAAKDGDTIKLLHNVTIDSQLVIDKAVTINMQNFTLTSTYAIPEKPTSGADRYAIVCNAAVKFYGQRTDKNGFIKVGQARAIGAYAALTLEKVTVTQELTGGHACVAFCANDTTYTVINSTIKGAYSVCVFANNATVAISGSTLNGTGNTLYHNGSNYGLKLTATNTTITSSGSCGVYISGSTSAQANANNQNGAGGYQQATFTGCTISGTNGVEVKYTDLTLDNCKVKATVETPSYKQNNNGPAAKGFAVVSTDNAMNNTTPAPEGKIIVKGENGNYTGPVGLGSLASIKTDYPEFKDETVKVSGGTFDHAIPYEYCAAGYIPADKGDGKYGVKEGTYVAEVNGKQYETLAEAFAAATDNSTIKLLTDITIEGSKGLEVKAGNGKKNVAPNVTFDLNGHKIDGSNVSQSTTLPAALTILAGYDSNWLGSVTITSSVEGTAIIGQLPLQINASGYADAIRVVVEPSVSLTVLDGGTNAILLNNSPIYLVASDTSKAFYKNGGFMATVGEESRIYETLGGAKTFNKEVKLLNDYKTSNLKVWSSWGAVTLDLDGHICEFTEKANMIELQEGANITFKNGTLKGSGASVIGMPNNNSTLTLDSVAVENAGNFGIATNGTTTNQTVTINNSTIKVPNGMGVYFPSTGKLTINGGSIEANTGVQICAGSLEITGNPTIKATATAAEAISSGSILDGAAVSIVGGRSGYGAMGEVTIDSGSFTSASGIEAVQAYTVNSNNQKADWTDAEAKVNISGGSYSTPVAENLCAEGFVPVTNGDGTYGVQPDGNVAEIGSVKYASLDEALKAAKDRETVKLLKDVEATQVLVTKGTLDLNGKTLKVSYFMSFSDVIDSTDGNGLIETGVQSFFTTNNSYLPLRDSAANGYRLFSYKLNKLGVVEGSSTAFWFNIVFGGKKAYSLLNTAGHNADLFIPMQIGSGNEWQYIKMNQSTLTKWTTPILNGTAPSKCGYYVNITGLDTLTSGTVLTLKTSIRSCGVEKLSDDSLTYTVK